MISLTVFVSILSMGTGLAPSDTPLRSLETQRAFTVSLVDRNRLLQLKGLVPEGYTIDKPTTTADDPLDRLPRVVLWKQAPNDLVIVIARPESPSGSISEYYAFLFLNKDGSLKIINRYNPIYFTHRGSLKIERDRLISWTAMFGDGNASNSGSLRYEIRIHKIINNKITSSAYTTKASYPLEPWHKNPMLSTPKYAGPLEELKLKWGWWG